MCIWKTVNNPSGFEVNIEQNLINAMKKEGSKFCWVKDNLGIYDRNNIEYFEDVSEDDNKEEKKNNKEEDVEDDNKEEDEAENHLPEDTRERKENIRVVDSDGNTVIGYVTHMVIGPCSGTPLCKWFIIQPGTYPTRYNISDVVITDL
tara:strand:- start:139 stop:582 length:444 start_codon:yes stop_codon:yes gene_type:complete